MSHDADGKWLRNCDHVTETARGISQLVGFSSHDLFPLIVEAFYFATGSPLIVLCVDVPALACALSQVIGHTRADRIASSTPGASGQSMSWLQLVRERFCLQRGRLMCPHDGGRCAACERRDADRACRYTTVSIDHDDWFRKIKPELRAHEMTKGMGTSVLASDRPLLGVDFDGNELGQQDRRCYLPFEGEGPQRPFSEEWLTNPCGCFPETGEKLD